MEIKINLEFLWISGRLEGRISLPSVWNVNACFFIARQHSKGDTLHYCIEAA